MGNQSKATGQRSLALGDGAQAGAPNAIAMGTGAVASAEDSISIGTGNQVSGVGSGAIGDPTTITGTGSYSVGNDNTIAADNAGTFGNDNTLQAAADGSRIIGNGNDLDVANAFVMGNGADVSVAEGVALGNGSVADTGAGVAGYNPTTGGADGLDADIAATQSTTGAVAVGDAGNGAYRQITGVAAGTEDSDAVNVSQLKASESHYYSVNDDGTQGGNYANDGATGVNAIAAGVDASATADGAVAMGYGATAGNADSVALGTDAVTAAPVGTTDTTIAGTTYTFAGGAPTGTVSVGDVGNERTITNVAAGRLDATSTDAINGSQLFATNQAVESASQGWDLTAQGTDGTNVAPGDAVDLSNTDGNLVIGKNATDGAQEDVTFELADDITVNSATAGNSVLGTTGLTVDDGAGNVTTTTAIGTSVTDGTTTTAMTAGGMTSGNINVDGTTDDITGLSNTDLSGGDFATAGRAATEEQLDLVNQELTTQGMNYAGDSGTDVHRDLGQTLNVVGGADASGNTNISTVANGTDGLAIVMTDQPQFGDVTVNTGGGDTINGLSNLTFDPNAFTSGQAATEDQLAQVNDTANAGWHLSAQDGAATNVAPDGEVNLRNADGNLEVSQATANGREEVTFDLANEVSIGTDGPTLNDDGIDMGGDTITNVGDPVDGGDAVNRDYFDENRAHYYSVNDDGTQGGNYANDGATGVNAIAAGVDASATADGAVAMGYGATAGNADSVALGTDAVTAAPVGTTAITLAGTTYTFAGGTPTGTVSLGDVGNERTLTNVAAGRISASSTDAINGSQLFATNQAVEEAVDTANTGWNLSAQGADTTNVAPDDAVDLTNADGNLSITKNATDGTQETVTFDLADAVSIGTDGPTLNDDGIDMGGDTITNVGTPVDGGDAANKTYVDNTSDALIAQGMDFTGNDNSAGDVHRDLGQTLAITGEATAGGTYSGENLQTVTDPATGAIQLQMTDQPQFGDVAINEGGSGRIGGVADGQDADDAVNVGQLEDVSNVANAGWNLSAQDGAATNVAPDGEVNLRNADGNLEVSQATTNGREEVTFDLSDDVELGNSLTVNDGPTLDGDGIDMGGDTITNVGDPVDGGDAVNRDYFDENRVHYYSVNDDGVIGGNYDNDGATGVNALAGGVGALASAEGGTSLGFGTQASIEGSVALGSGSVANRALAPATGAIPAGSATIEYNTTDKALLGAVSVGDEDSYRQITNVADGIQAQDAVTVRQLQGAIGSVIDTGIEYFHANSDQPDSLAVGEDSIAVGPTTVVNGDAGIGMGNGAIVDQVAPGGTAIGDGAHVMLADGMALGTESLSEAAQGIALGAGATVSHDQSVALGSNSVTADPVATPGTTIAGTDYAFAGVAPDSTVSVGDVGAERTITNVAAGRLSADSTDAVNGSQLFATNRAVETASQGWDLSAQGVDTTNVAPGDSVDLANTDGNLVIDKNATDGAQEDVTFDLSDDVTLGNSLTINDGPTIDGDGIDMGGDTITNVGAPVDGGDATNKTYVDNLGGDLVAQGMDFAGNDGGVVHRDLGQALSITGEATASGTFSGENLKTVTDPDTGTIQLQMADAPQFGDVVINEDDSGRISGVADGQDGDDAVNVSQLEDVSDVASAGWDLSAQDGAATNVAPGGEVNLRNADGNLEVTQTTANGREEVTFDLSDQVMIGDVAINEDGSGKIGGVADGEVSETSKDAVNGSQLWETQQALEEGQTHYYSVNDGGSQGGNYANDGATGVNAIAAGVDASATADGAIAMGDGATASEAGSVALGSGATTEAAVGTADITLGGQTYAFAGAAPVGTFSVGSAGAERTITNVAAGRISADSTDAINGSQLHATNQAVESVEGRVGDVEGDVNELGDRVTNVEGDVANIGDEINQLDDQAVKYDTNDDGSVNHDSITLEGDHGTTITNVADGDVSASSSDAVNGSQLWEVQKQISNVEVGETKYFKANSEAADARAEGAESVAMGPESVAQGDQSVATGDGAVAESDGGVALGAGSQATREGMDGAEEAFSGESVASTQGAVSVGSDGGERQITHVAGGTEATDAVNVRQLESVQAGAVNYDRHDDGSVDYSSVTMGQEGTPTQIHNVAAGEAPTDAANVGQLQELNQQFNQQIGGVHNRIDEVERDANAGIAGVAALGNAPYVPGKLTYHVGGGYHGGESAVGVNFRRTADNGRWSLTAGAAGSRAGATISLGVSGVID